MRHNRTSWLLIGGLGVVATAVFMASNQLSQLTGQLTEVLRQRGSDMQTITEEVATQSGRTVTVTTTKTADETHDQWIARHDAAVQAAKEL